MTGLAGQTHADAMQAEINRGKALEMKLGGATYRDIAKALGVSVSTAHGYIKDIMDDVREQNVELAADMRRLAVARLDKMLLSLWTKRDQPRVADTILRIEERRAKILGLDAPLRWEGSGPNGGPIPVQGEIDLSKLTIDQLKQLEEIVLSAQATAVAAAPVARIAAETDAPLTTAGDDDRRLDAGMAETLSTAAPATVTDPSSNGNTPH